MFVELIESLRCPREHEESALIASAKKTEARHIVEGVLGCPVCGEEFSVVDAELHVDADAGRGASEAPSAETAMRLAAFLELTDARGAALLLGRWAAHADQVMRITEAPLVLVNAPAGRRPDVAASILSRDVVPFAPGSARGAALDASMSDALRESAVNAVRSGGRLVGDASLPLPPGVREIVRDDVMWVGEKTAASNPTPRLVPLSKRV
jgi:hypothetical protein